MKKSLDYIVFDIISYIFVGAFALFTLLPFVMLVMSSFASENYIINHGFTLFPREISLSAYNMIFKYPVGILNAYSITIFITVFGTACSLFLSSMAAYVIYRKDLKYRNFLAFFVYFTTLFNGGLVSYYIILSNVYKLQNTIFVLLLVPMFNALYILILKNFIKGSIPDTLSESAKIDGAGDFRIFIQIVLPLSKAALASIGMFTALAYWNDWWTAMMFVQPQNLHPLQYVLYSILSDVNASANLVNKVPSLEMPKESLKLALTVVTTGPIIFAYPFVQKYFVKGVTIGAVKG